ncbi:AraC-like DNA-binding protein [Frondihabitans sp. PhB188]|uniref:AraC family transcriptional regulator n=1 Tax=Frondihabitans sp. PhB188 TaxID=2485200 RepID=UPI000F47DEA8|nr:AraC family transcriptional regulator [Frondihabitans sp. PhB188]ROQ36540.1 AraC-like DNA-binding protein [Frondihabitans sp. PhB188]
MRENPDRLEVDTSGTDIVEAREMLASAYNGVEWRAGECDAPFSFRYAAAGDSSMTVRALRFEGHMEGEMPAGDDFVVTSLSRGTGRFDDGRREVVAEPGVPQLWPTDPFTFGFEQWDQRLVQVNRTTVETILGERGVYTGHLAFDHTARPTDQALQRWRQTVSLISATVLDRHASPLLQAEMGRIAAVSLIELYPLTAAELPAELLLPRYAHVRRAVEYAHEHAHLPITTADLARIANVSLRTLQQAFVRHFDMSPNSYLRQIRLDSIHEELLLSDPSTATVAGIAQKWGMAHAGRFAAAYAQRHGQYPSETLASRRR